MYVLREACEMVKEKFGVKCELSQEAHTDTLTQTHTHTLSLSPVMMRRLRKRLG